MKMDQYSFPKFEQKTLLIAGGIYLARARARVCVYIGLRWMSKEAKCFFNIFSTEEFFGATELKVANKIY
jgi:hypothetical protein